jgi:uncharacterized protein (TIGR02145 family)
MHFINNPNRMKKRIFQLISRPLVTLGLLCLFVINTHLFAQAPDKMSYQSVVRDNNNRLVTNGNVGVQISILQGSATNGTVFYVERHSGTTNANGLLTIEIGDGQVVQGSFSSINWANGPYFIKTETDPTGGTNYSIEGVSQFLSVPYALYAKESGTAGPAGQDGKSVLNDSIDPDTTVGVLGDFFINTTNNTLFGPKTALGWGTATSLVGPQGQTGATGAQGPQGIQGIQGATGPQGLIGAQGPQGIQGATGAQGPQGTAGVDGKTVLNGTANPTSTLGAVGDFYINISNNTLFGPKTALGWGTATSLVGPQGATGAQGPQGIQGATGPQGLIGAQGPQGIQGATGAQGPQGIAGQGGVSTAGSNINITGSGTVASPYVINALVSDSQQLSVSPTGDTLRLQNGGFVIIPGISIANIQDSIYRKGTTHCTSNPTLVIDVYNPVTNKTWMDRNLGASQVATHQDDSMAFGDLYQWGRKADGHQCRNTNTSPSLSSTDLAANSDFFITNNSPNDWRNPQNPNLWQGINGINNPCPYGYRVPTSTELNNERLSWSSNNSSEAFNSPLKFTRSGGRNNSSGQISTTGNQSGYYWSSTPSGSPSNTNSNYLTIGFNSSSIGSINRAFGNAIRCIKD